MSKICFVISVIGDEGSPERKHADELLNFIIKPVAEELGYTVERADHDSRPGMIPHQIIEKILRSDLVIADLSFPNPNVYYEIGIRHCTGKRFVHVALFDKPLPFDIAQVRGAKFGLGLTEAEAGKAELRKAIAASAGDTEPVSNPVTQTQVAVLAKSSGDATERMLGTIVESLKALSSKVDRLEVEGSSDRWGTSRSTPKLNAMLAGRWSDRGDGSRSFSSEEIRNHLIRALGTPAKKDPEGESDK